MGVADRLWMTSLGHSLIISRARHSTQQLQYQCKYIHLHRSSVAASSCAQWDHHILQHYLHTTAVSFRSESHHWCICSQLYQYSSQSKWICEHINTKFILDPTAEGHRLHDKDHCLHHCGRGPSLSGEC